MSRKVFLDTNGWLALLNASDSLHAQATAAWKSFRPQYDGVATTDQVIAETGHGMARGASRMKFAAAAKRLLASPDCTVIFTDETLMARSLSLYQSRADKEWGLVDCISFVIMQQTGITDAFTTDHHFEQAGINCLLRRT